MKKSIVHQVYGPGAIRTACGLNLHTANVKTALPGCKVTCKMCNHVEATRRIEAKARKAKIIN